jgi:hypothetical protein
MNTISAPASVSAWVRPWRRPSLGTFSLWCLGGVVALSMVLPACYLIVRSLDGPLGLYLQTLLRPVVGRYLLNTVGLAAVTTFLACVIGIVGGWLTARTDLPAATMWTVLLSLPLALPSYIGAYAYLAAFGPKTWVGLKLLAPLGLTVRESFWGGGAALDFFDLPIRVVARPLPVGGDGPGACRGLIEPGVETRKNLLRCNAPVAPPGSGRRWIVGGALCYPRFWRGCNAGVSVFYLCDIPGARGSFQPAKSCNLGAPSRGFVSRHPGNRVAVAEPRTV